MDYFIVITSSILSGVLGVIISTIYYKKTQRRQEKISLLTQLYGNRYDLNGHKFSEALNSIIIIFWDNKEVLKNLKEFHEVVSRTNKTDDDVNSSLIDLLKVMGDDVGLEFEGLNDTFLLKVFNSRKPIVPNVNQSKEK